jgi:hypothetical protein
MKFLSCQLMTEIGGFFTTVTEGNTLVSCAKLVLRSQIQKKRGQKKETGRKWFEFSSSENPCLVKFICEFCLFPFIFVFFTSFELHHRAFLGGTVHFQLAGHVLIMVIWL